jgi:signal peptidase I
MNDEVTTNSSQPEFSPSPLPSTKDTSLKELIKFALIAIVIIVPIRLFIARPFVVSGDSMVPTFLDGQYLIVDQLSYKLEKPQRGDVIIFKYPLDQTKYFIKRVIGLPNETISSQNGIITISDKKNPQGIVLKEPYLVNKSADSWSHSTGDNEYFVMGDNRPWSSDSRAWGNLNESYIVGRPLIRVLPINQKNILPGRDTSNSSI